MAETQAPKFIYLQDGGNLEPLPADQYNEQVTWCEVSVEDNDTKYVRADLHEELERQLADFQQSRDEWKQRYTEMDDLRIAAERQLAEAEKQARIFYAQVEERGRIIEATRRQLATARQDERERCAQAVIGTSIDDYGTLSHCAAVIRGQT